MLATIENVIGSQGTDNGGTGWDHPIRLFEEGITMNRGDDTIPAKERVAAGAGGRVTFQVQFGEFAGSCVNHCHNTVHKDFAMHAAHAASRGARNAGGGYADAKPDAGRSVLLGTGGPA